MLVDAKNKQEIVKLKFFLSSEFVMQDLGVSKKILGIEIYRDKGASKLWLFQKGYLKKVLRRFSMLDTNLLVHRFLPILNCPHNCVQVQMRS